MSSGLRERKKKALTRHKSPSSVFKKTRAFLYAACLLGLVMMTGGGGTVGLPVFKGSSFPSGGLQDKLEKHPSVPCPSRPQAG